MPLNFKPTKKTKSGYKSLYISDELANKVILLSKKYDTSFNSIIVNIIEDFFKRQEMTIKNK